MRLDTNFVDYYDNEFSGVGFKIKRFKESISKLEILRLLKEKGYEVPHYGKVKDLYNPLYPYKKIIIYPDVDGVHVKDSFKLLSHIEALRVYPLKLCFQYEKDFKIIQEIRIGNHCFVLEYRNISDYTRCSKSSISCYHNSKADIDVPIYSISFLVSDKDKIAFDYEPYPVLGGTGIEDFLSSKEVADILSHPILKRNGWV
ncbi:hypothetical protein [Metabacillus niabensis]|uniref:hypothetical protein n=1 Tax=Metabacillus niabensis TaxID=324854 RepID=UPI0039A20968